MAKSKVDFKERIAVIGGIQTLLKATVNEDMTEELRDVSIHTLDLLVSTCMSIKEDINKQFDYYTEKEK